MKKFFVALTIMILVCAWSASSGAFPAQTLTFTDNYPPVHWNGWASPDVADNSQDTIGIPNIIGGEVELDDMGYLDSVRIEFAYWVNGWPFDMLQAGDLFLDFGANQVWDFVVDTSAQLLYNVNIALGDASSYVLSDTTWTNPYAYRENHPVEVAQAALPADNMGPVSFSGMGAVIEYDFSLSDGVYIGYNPLIVGWTLNCANDVLYERVDPIPEPGTLLLLGAGLIGLLALGRKRFAK